MKEVFVIEEYDWYQGGSGIDIYENKEDAVSAIERLTKNKREWRAVQPCDPRVIVEYQNQFRSKSFELRKLPINPASPSAASSASSSSRPDGA